MEGLLAADLASDFFGPEGAGGTAWHRLAFYCLREAKTVTAMSLPRHSMGLPYMPISWGGFGGQCRHIWHTWSVWVWYVVSWYVVVHVVVVDVVSCGP